MEDRQRANGGSVVVGELTSAIKAEEPFQEIRRSPDPPGRNRGRNRKREKEIIHYAPHEKKNMKKNITRYKFN